MKHFIILLFTSVVALLTCSANAALITSDSIAHEGAFNGDLQLVGDGYFPTQANKWDIDTLWWQSLATSFTIDFGSVLRIEDMLLSVDNNDDYLIEYLKGDNNWGRLFAIGRNLGEVTWGMDTMSSDATHGEYIAQIDFAPINSRSIRISATGGDNSYSIGELQVFGNRVAASHAAQGIPEPASLLLIAFGLLSLAISGRRSIRVLGQTS